VAELPEQPLPAAAAPGAAPGVAPGVAPLTTPAAPLQESLPAPVPPDPPVPTPPVPDAGRAPRAATEMLSDPILLPAPLPPAPRVVSAPEPVVSIPVPAPSGVSPPAAPPPEDTTRFPSPAAAPPREAVLSVPEVSTVPGDPPGYVSVAPPPATPPPPAAPPPAAPPSPPATPPPPSPGPEEVFTVPVVPPARPSARSQQVSRNERFTVTLPGPGWIYLGGSDTVEFLGRAGTATEVSFTFRLTGDDPAQLRFEQQDLTSGTRISHVETVTPRVGSRPPAPPVAPGTAIDTTRAAVPGATPSGSDQENRRDPDPLSQLLEGRGPLDAGERELLDQLLAGVLDGSIVPDDATRWNPLLDRLQDDAGLEAAILLSEHLVRTGAGPGDLPLFRLATLLEQPGPHRDLARARLLYRQLMEEFPFSTRWDAARARVEYLDRHFFFIR
jgi:hypothetical protein